MNKILTSYKKLISLLICFLVFACITLFIKYYFKPFILVLIMAIICAPIYGLMNNLNIPEKISGALCIAIINILLILFIIYLGNEIFNLGKNIYSKNLEFINTLIKDISMALNVDISNLKIGKSVFSIISDKGLRQGAISTGEMILAYFMANICTYFILVDRKYIIEIFELLFPKNLTNKFMNHKNNFKHMIVIEGILVLISIFEIIVGFTILGIPNGFMLGIVCGVLDILPYVGTIIVFIPIIIYNIIMKKYITAIGLVCLYILIQVVREVLEAKFLGAKLDIHPLVILISIYVGMNIFGILGMIAGPMYSIIAKEIIYSTE
ncbi:AI-2E family transporter [Clostridium sp. SM-530-WT-3G]|uniref:AI-2E family transporter n=1 Tax=Clostridium sp. SM-530-WT-3G TaxID=2725303 RepID=UPI00145E9F8F|nr:AI-2E family transporter [Clostridium sp. SM-530-WT-3G]